jgi:hypothetical protein
MAQIDIGPFTVEVDAEATRAGYATSPGVDPSCCNACATFMQAVSTKSLSSKLMDILNRLGADPSKPVEAWGAPDGGFLQVWWPFVGTFAADNPNNEESFMIGEGQSVRVTTHYPAPDWIPPPGLDVPALELTWVGTAVQELERRTTTPTHQ